MNKKLKSKAPVKDGRRASAKLADVEETLHEMEEKVRRLGESEQKYRALFEDIKDGIFISTGERIIVDANGAAAKLWGYDREELIGMFSGNLFVQTPELEKTRALLRQQGFVKDVPVQSRRKDGSIVVCLSTVSSWKDDTGKLLGWQTIVRDVTHQREVERSLSHLAAIIAASRDSVTSVDLEGKVLSWNPAAERVYGYKAEEVLGKVAPIGIPPGMEDDRPRLREAVVRGESIQEHETRRVTKDGRVIDVSLTLSPIRDTSGKTSTISIIARDITSRKRRERALSEAEEKYRKLFEDIRDALFIADASGRLIDANDAWCELFGYTRDEMPGLTAREIFVQTPIIARAREALHQKGFLKDLEILCRRKDGSQFDGLQTVSVWRDEKGNILGYQNIIRDVTEQKERERALVEAEEKYRRLFESSSEAIGMIGIDGRVIEMNRGFDALLGYARHEMTSIKAVPIFVYKSDEVNILGRMLGNGEAFRDYEARLRRKDGSEIDCLINGSKQRDSDGKVVGLEVIIRDVSERKKAEAAMAQLAAVVESSDDGIVCDSLEDGSYLIWNKGEERLFGYTFEEVKHKKPGFLIPPDMGAPDVAQRVARVARGETIRNIETRRMAKDGRILDVSITMCPVRDRTGKIVASMSITRDISERKKQERALRTAEEKYRRLFDNSMDALSLGAEDGKIIEANEEFLELFGYSREDLGTLYGEQLYEDPNDRLRSREELNRKGSYRDKEVRLKKKDGTVFECLLAAAKLTDDQGAFLGYQGIYKDITERKKWERAQAQLAAIVESSDDAITSFDMDGTILTWNKGAKKLYGYSAEEALGNKAFLNVPQGVADDRPGLFARLARGESIRNYETQRVRKDGQTIFISRTLSPIWDSEGKVVAICGIARDITEQKRSEERLRETSRLVAVGELAAGVAHEINNPLASVSGFAELMMMRDLPPDIARDVSRIHSEAKRAATIVHNLLSFARHHEPAKKSMSLKKVLDLALGLKAYDLRLNNIKVDVHYDPSIPEFMADEHQLAQVFLNIITNAEQAIMASKGKGSITIESTRVGNNVRVKVADDGPGIPKEDLSRIFDPFFTTKEVGSGTGLGLSMCYGLLKAHNGEIWAESEPGKGATFYLELPLVVAGETSAPPSKGKPRVSGGKVLVVDDEPSIVEFLRRAMMDRGYEVDVAKDGEEAWTFMTSKPYDAILMDLRMPGLSGPKLYQRLKEQKAEAAKRVVFVTGDALSPHTRKFIEGSGNAWLEKPFTLQDVDKLIQEKVGKGA
jgi:PAS domain S-box-containing protein